MGKPRKSQQPVPGLSRRSLILTGGLLSIFGAMYVFSDRGKPVQTTPYRVTFEDAKRDPALRQQYFDQNASYFQRPFVRSVHYRASAPPHLTHAGAGFEQQIDDIGKRIPSDVQVWPYAFEAKSVTNEKDFLNVIIDHEIDGHARLSYEGIPHFTIDQFRTGTDAAGRGTYHDSLGAIVELIVYGYQIVQGRTKEVSRAQFENNFTNYGKYYERLFTTPRTGLKDPAVVDKALALLFQKDFLRTTYENKPLIVQEGDQFLWHVKNGIYTPLPKSVCDKIREVK